MIRAAAKNHAFAAVVVKPEAYDAVLEELRAGDGQLSLATREALAAEAFAYTARYDTAIARWFAERGEDFPPLYVRAFEKVVDLPYGENPHQRAAYYQQVGARMHVLSMVTPAPRQGALVQQPARPRRGARRSCASSRSRRARSSSTTTRAARRVARTRAEAYQRAFACDPLSAFGGVIALQPPGRRARWREALDEQFVEVLFAPGYDDDALEILDAASRTCASSRTTSAGVPLPASPRSSR